MRTGLPQKVSAMANSGRGSGLRNLLLGILLGVAAAWAVHYFSLRVRDVAEPPPLWARDVSGVQPSTRLPNPLARQVAERLRKGGLIIYFRHAQRQKWDSVIAFDVYETATGTDASAASWKDAVCLTPQGVEEAKMIGGVFELAQIPVGAVVASPSCRAQQTATLAFGRIDRTSTALVHTPALNVDNLETFRAGLANVLREIPLEVDRNAIVVAHTNTLENNASIFADGTKWLADPLPFETGCYIIERDAEGRLTILYEFSSLGELASSAFSLDPATMPP